MHLIDTHCHLYMDPLVRDVPGVLERARARGVQEVIVPAYDPPSWLAMAQIAPLPGVHVALGLHPWVADAQFGPPRGGQVERELDLASRKDAIRRGLGGALGAGLALAVGEIGLDHNLDFEAGAPSPELQREILRTQLELAVELDKPVILHCRGAFAELLEEVQRFGGKLRGVLHAYSRGTDPARSFLAAGLHIGLGGAITRDRARRARQAAQELPLDKILLETDAPSIGLDGVEPADTEPQHVRDVAEALAGLRDEKLETIAEVTTAHARELFRLPA